MDPHHVSLESPRKLSPRHLIYDSTNNNTWMLFEAWRFIQTLQDVFKEPDWVTVIHRLLQL